MGIAIWQLSMAQGKTELRGNPFDDEAKEKNVLHNSAVVSKTFEPKALDEAFESTKLPAETSDELKFRPVDLKQAIVLTEILAPPRAKQTRRRQ